MTSISKLEHPPTVENWARMQFPEVDRTAKALFNFVRGGPIWNYEVGRKAIKYRIEDRISADVALGIVERFASPLAKSHNYDFVGAFCDYEALNPIDGVKSFDDFRDAFPLSRAIRIPVKPLTVVREKGTFTPVMVCPWSSISLDTFQASLVMTVLEKSLYSHTDFEDSEGKVFFFPKIKNHLGHLVRQPMIWKRGDFPLLSDRDLNDQIRVFMEGRKLAALLYQDFVERGGQ